MFEYRFLICVGEELNRMHVEVRGQLQDLVPSTMWIPGLMANTTAQAP